MPACSVRTGCREFLNRKSKNSLPDDNGTTIETRLKTHPIRILVISSVRPEPTLAGQITLHRHLAEHSGVEWEAFGFEPTRLTTSSAVRRLMGRLAGTRLRRFAHDYWAWRDGRWLDGLLPQSVADRENTIVLTVAQGDIFGAARRFANQHHLPLVAIFHDWWPDMTPVHAAFRPLVERKFRDIYRHADVALCVSEGMQAALGPHPNARVLYPIPAHNNPLPPPTSHENFRVLFFGNLGEYGPMMAAALNELKEHAAVRLETRGNKPWWPEEFKAEMERKGLWHNYAPLAELNKWLATADAFLVPMVFDPALRQRMETSFPSKMVEMAQLGRPIIVWGPEYCSAVKWAREGERALCITDPDPSALRRSLETLANSPSEQQRLADAAREAAQTDFNPNRIQHQFMTSLQNAALVD